MRTSDLWKRRCEIASTKDGDLEGEGGVSPGWQSRQRNDRDQELINTPTPKESGNILLWKGLRPLVKVLSVEWYFSSIFMKEETLLAYSGTGLEVVRVTLLELV